MRNRLRNKIENLVEDKTWATTDGCVAGAESAADAIIDALGLEITSASREHRAGSALEFNETAAEYAERTRMKTHYRIAGRWEENA